MMMKITKQIKERITRIKKMKEKKKQKSLFEKATLKKRISFKPFITIFKSIKIKCDLICKSI